MLTEIINVLQKLWGSSTNCQSFYVKPTHNMEHGDFFSNICLVNKNINAEDLMNTLSSLDCVKQVEIKSGFVNIFIKDQIMLKFLDQIPITPRDCQDVINPFPTGINGEYKDGPLNITSIEYGSINPTGEAHCGHLRGLALGSAIANLLKTNQIVVQEYYINDAGAQISKLLDSIYTNAMMKKYPPEDYKSLDLPEITYGGSYIQELAQKFVAEVTEDPIQFYQQCKNQVINSIVEDHIHIIHKLRIHHDIFTKESVVMKLMDQVMDYLCKKGVILALDNDNSYLITNWNSDIPGKIAMIIEGEADDQRILRRENGIWTYFANDICLHWLKIKRGVSRIIAIMGEDHIGYFSRLKHAVHLLNENVTCDFFSFAMVHIKDENNERVRMSKRKGNAVTIKELGEAIGYDCSKFLMLLHNKDTPIEINLSKIKENWMNNPLIYVQYAYARICSVERTFNGIEKVEQIDYTPEEFDCIQERTIVRQLCLFPQVLVSARDQLNPHILAEYVLDLARIFHSWWSLGQHDEKMRFISKNINQTTKKMKVLLHLKGVIKFIMDIFSITLEESM